MKKLCFLAGCIVVAALSATGSANAAGTGSIGGAVTNPDGGPIDGVIVCAYRVDSEVVEEVCDQSGEDGLYGIGDLEEGSYKIEFRPESNASPYIAEFYGDTRDWEAATVVQVREGAITSGIDAQLALGATIEGEVRAASLSGPVEFALVCAKPAGGGEWLCAQTEADGSYALGGLLPGTYAVEFIPASNLYNLLNQSYDHKALPAEADPLTLAAGEVRTGVDADLPEGNEISGTVYSAKTGAPLGGIVVCVLQPNENFPKGCQSSEPDGSYAIFAIPGGSWRVGFSVNPGPEFFGEEPQPWEDDGYLNQYWDHKRTLRTATLIPMVAPQVKAGVDAHLLPDPRSKSPLQSASAFSLPLERDNRPSNCRAGSELRQTFAGRRCVDL